MKSKMLDLWKKFHALPPKRQFGCSIIPNINFDTLIPNHPKLSGIKSDSMDGLENVDR